MCRECLGALLQASRNGSTSQLACPLCRATVQSQDLVKGVNEAHEEEDSFTAALEQQASTSESKLNALLEEVSVILQQPIIPSTAFYVVMHVVLCMGGGLRCSSKPYHTLFASGERLVSCYIIPGTHVASMGVEHQTSDVFNGWR